MMKKITLFILLTLPFISLAQPSASINWDEVLDRYVEKYQPEKIPKWLFPMIFEKIWM